MKNCGNKTKQNNKNQKKLKQKLFKADTHPPKLPTSLCQKGRDSRRL